MALEVRRIVTRHYSQGKAVVATNERLAAPARRGAGRHLARRRLVDRQDADRQNEYQVSVHDWSTIGPHVSACRRPRASFHLCSPDPDATARFFETMFGAEVTRGLR
jgi:hypothetical protein